MIPSPPSFSHLFATRTFLDRPNIWPNPNSGKTLDGQPLEYFKINFYLPTKDPLDPPIVESVPVTDLDQKDIKPSIPKNWMEKTMGIAQQDIAIRQSMALYTKIQAQLDDFDFPGGLNLNRNYNTWYELSVIHIWMVLSRLRIENEKDTAQDLFNRFWQDCLRKLPKFGFVNPFMYNKFMDKQMHHYYGALIAYDSGEDQNDAILSSAIWRHLFQANSSGENLAKAVEYVRSNISKMDSVGSKQFLESEFDFLQPKFP